MANGKRLIDVDVAEKSIRTSASLLRANIGCGYDEGAADALSLVADMLKTMPTVDAVEVKHGHMVERIVDHECPWYTIYDCSECGCSVERWHSYCPNCGAKMDGDGNG